MSNLDPQLPPPLQNLERDLRRLKPAPYRGSLPGGQAAGTVERVSRDVTADWELPSTAFPWKAIGGICALAAVCLFMFLLLSNLHPWQGPKQQLELANEAQLVPNAGQTPAQMIGTDQPGDTGTGTVVVDSRGRALADPSGSAPNPALQDANLREDKHGSPVQDPQTVVSTQAHDESGTN